MAKLFVYNPAIEQIASQARVATDLAQLTAICTRLDIADCIYLGKSDLWMAKHALSALYRNLKRYPALREKMRYFGTLNGFIKNKNTLIHEITRGDPWEERILAQSTDDLAVQMRTGFEGQTLATAFIAGSYLNPFTGIVINGKSMHQQTILQHLQYSEAVGFAPKGCNSVKSVVDHEVGHILDFMLEISSCSAYRQFIRPCSVAQIRAGLSEYSVMNNEIAHGEVIAEAFSESCNNPAPREISRRIRAMIDQKYVEYCKGIR